MADTRSHPHKNVTLRLNIWWIEQTQSRVSFTIFQGTSFEWEMEKLEWRVYRMLWSFHECRFSCKREKEREREWYWLSCGLRMADGE